jgi:hypothetical protein
MNAEKANALARISRMARISEPAWGAAHAARRALGRDGARAGLLGFVLRALVPASFSEGVVLSSAGSAASSLLITAPVYPPDLEEKATQTVLEQAKVLCAEVSG